MLATVASEPLHLVGFHHRVRPGYGVLARPLEVERAVVALRVPVGPAERGAAPALEPRQPHLLVATPAPVCCLRLRLLRGCDGLRRRGRIRGQRSGAGGGAVSLVVRVGGGRLAVEGDLDGGLGGGGALLLKAEILVALGAEVHGGWVAPEPAAVGTELRLGAGHARPLVLLGTHVARTLFF